MGCIPSCLKWEVTVVEGCCINLLYYLVPNHFWLLRISDSTKKPWDRDSSAAQKRLSTVPVIQLECSELCKNENREKGIPRLSMSEFLLAARAHAISPFPLSLSLSLLLPHSPPSLSLPLFSCARVRSPHFFVFGKAKFWSFCSV